MDLTLELIVDSMTSMMETDDLATPLDMAKITNFLADVQDMVHEFQKSVLIDAELHKFAPSMIAAGLISATLEIKFHELRKSSPFSYSDQIPSVRLLRKLCCD